MNDQSKLEPQSDWSLPSDLVRIEKKLDEILSILKKPKRVNGKKPVMYPEQFEVLWGMYPKRAGGNSKVKASNAFKARLMEGMKAADMEKGLLAYKRFCEATDRIGTEYVMQASRFFGPSMEWQTDWTPPEKKKEMLSDQDWIDDGAIKSIFPKPGESMASFRNRVRSQ